MCSSPVAGLIGSVIQRFCNVQLGSPSKGMVQITERGLETLRTGTERITLGNMDIRRKELVAIGVLQEVQVGKEKLFIHPKLMQLLIRDSNDFKSYA